MATNHNNIQFVEANRIWISWAFSRRKKFEKWMRVIINCIAKYCTKYFNDNNFLTDKRNIKKYFAIKMSFFYKIEELNNIIGIFIPHWKEGIVLGRNFIFYPPFFDGVPRFMTFIIQKNKNSVLILYTLYIRTDFFYVVYRTQKRL